MTLHKSSVITEGAACLAESYGNVVEVADTPVLETGSKE